LIKPLTIIGESEMEVLISRRIYFYSFTVTKIQTQSLIVQSAGLLFFYQPSSVRGWTSAFLLAVHRLGGVIEPFSATLAQDGLAECDQPGKNPLKYSAMAGN